MSSPRPDLLFALPGLVAERVAQTLPALRTCKGIAGRIDVDELKRTGIAAPAVLVSRLGTRQSQVMAGPYKTYSVDMAAFIVARDELGLGRDEAAANIAAALLMLVPEKTWGQVGVSGATDVRETPLITSASQGTAIALTAITWSQIISLEGFPLSATVPLSLYLGQAPEIGAAHQDDYELVGGAP